MHLPGTGGTKPAAYRLSLSQAAYLTRGRVGGFHNHRPRHADHGPRYCLTLRLSRAGSAVMSRGGPVARLGGVVWLAGLVLIGLVPAASSSATPVHLRDAQSPADAKTFAI